MYDQRPCSCVEIYARYRAKSLSSIIDRAQDCALIAAAQTSRRAVVIGASFIGLEVAASLRTRASRSTSLARRRVHLKRIMGAEIGDFIRNVHEQHGVTFRLGTTATAINAHDGRFNNGDVLPADLVVVGIGVRPVTALAEQAGLVNRPRHCGQ
jgi:apoptosis-inducing factor 3